MQWRSHFMLEKMGNLDAQRVVHQHQGWRLISFQIGFLYLMSGFGGSLLSALFIQYGISVGASGALFGLLGSMLSELTSNWTI
nr:RHOMBOID-like protein 2 isoform X2 [Malus domestica]